MRAVCQNTGKILFHPRNAGSRDSGRANEGNPHVREEVQDEGFIKKGREPGGRDGEPGRRYGEPGGREGEPGRRYGKPGGRNGVGGG